MKSYTFSEARQNFAAILEQARRDGAVRIQRRDGQSFVLLPEQKHTSPLDAMAEITMLGTDWPATKLTFDANGCGAHSRRSQ